MRVFKRICLFFVALAVVFVILSLVAVPWLILHPYRPKPVIDALAHRVRDGMKVTAMRLRTPDGVSLDGFVMTPGGENESMPTVLLLHGICSAKEGYLSFAEMITGEGFRVVAFDSRGHGRTQGGSCTYGWHEKKDVSLIIDEVRKIDATSRIGIFGNSMGGAIALQAMEADKRIECGVIESTFATFHEAAFLRAASVTKVRLDPIFYPGLWRAESLGNWKLKEVRPEISALAIHQPVLLSHGTADEVFPISQGERIYRNLRSPAKEWFPINGGKHFGMGKIYGPGYEKRQIDFFKKWLAAK